MTKVLGKPYKDGYEITEGSRPQPDFVWYIVNRSNKRPKKRRFCHRNSQNPKARSKKQHDASS